MATMLFALPIRSGQKEVARAFAQECIGPRYAEYAASEQRIGIQVENWYLQRNSAGEFFTIYVEGPDLMSSFGAFISSCEPFDLWFKEQILALTGIDLNVGPPPKEMFAETLAEYKEDLMSDQQAMPPNSMGQQFTEGTPVYDVNGEQVGRVSKHGLAENTLILHKGIFFHRNIQVPLSTVQRSDANGIYLSVSKDELQHERYAAPKASAESGAGELISRGVDEIEQTPHTFTKGVDEIEQTPHTFTKGTDTIEQTPDTFTKGTDTIERNAEGPISS